MLKKFWPAIMRLLRVVVAQLPFIVTWLQGNPDPKLALLGPVINAIAKYLRDAYKWEWLPV